MLIVILGCLLLLTLINFIVAEKSPFHPAVAYSGIWTFSLVCIFMAGDTYYPLSDDTLMIVLYGALAFSLGAICGKYILVPQGSLAHRAPQPLITVFVVALLAAFPFYVIWLFKLIVGHPREYFLASSRAAFIELMEMGPEKYTLDYIFFINALALVSMVALVAWAEREKAKKRAAIALALAFAYHIPTGARAAIVQLILSILCVHWLIHRRLKWRTLAIAFAAILAVFVSIAIIVHIVGLQTTTSASENVHAGFTEFLDYAAGPLVAFDRVVREPWVVPHTRTAWSFFVDTASKLGMKVDVPTGLPEFIQTGPDTRQNVHTLYFDYLDVGWPFAFFLIFLQGAALGIIYKLAMEGSKQWVVVYGFLFSCIVLTVFDDTLMGPLNAILKTVAFCWVCYSLPEVLRRLSAAGKRISSMATT